MVTGLNHITLSVIDLDRSFNFYSRTLGFAPVARWETGAYLEAAELWLALITDSKVSSASRPDYSHFALSCETDEFEAMVAALKAEGCDAWSENISEGASYYFCDPDGHKLEIHVGDLETRLKEMRRNPWTEIRFFR